ncbi:hypothetical protein [Rhodoligotrophos ferricapiens]|uniref:hypothetical protein n=1 Tax=Rhodoligotrophos ferricapiens TaxID=3069264 RepID=UPI00315D7424
MSKAETIRIGRLGKKELRLVRKDGRFFGLAHGKVCVEGEKADDVWRQLHDDAGKGDPKYFGFEGAWARFLRFFPNGFHSAGYTNAERDYKIAAKQRLDETAPLEQAVTASGLGEPVLAVFRATNLLSPFEKVRLQDVLRGPAADEFIRAAARFTLGEGKPALVQMERALKPHDNAKWTVATYLPFLWRPEEHMFLKPEVTKDFAARVGHRFASDYEPRLNFAVYESLLDLVSKTAAELVELKPRDRIDVQSFIWVVGDYKEDSEQSQP